MKAFRSLVPLLGLALGMAASSAYALINPHFTPIHLVKQAALIVSVDLKQGQSKDQYAATVREVLKGKTELKTLRLDLSKAINTQNADALRDLATAEAGAVLCGRFLGERDGQGGEPAKSSGLLHVSGQWAEFDGGQDGVWAFSQIDGKSQGIWAGGTDMLRRAVDYILQDDDPEVPVADGAPGAATRRRLPCSVARSGPCGQSTWPATAVCSLRRAGPGGPAGLRCEEQEVRRHYRGPGLAVEVPGVRMGRFRR